MAQIFIRNVDFAVRPTELQIGLASLIHKPPFQNDPPINFHVNLFRRQGVRDAHKGCGLLTFPYPQQAELFLRLYVRSGPRPVSMRGRVIEFSASNRAIGDSEHGLIRRLQENAWEDPLEIQQRNERHKRNSQPVPLQHFSFGCYCRDGKFSAEQEFAGTCSISCDQEQRSIIVSFKPTSTPSSPVNNESSGLLSVADMMAELLGSALTLGSRAEFMAVYHQARITAICATRSNSVFIEADLAPTLLEKSPPGPLSEMLEPDREPLPQRVTKLPGHASDTPYAMLGLALTFQNMDTQSKFLQRCRTLNLPRQDHDEVEIVNRSIYSESNIGLMKGVLRGLDFPLAFQVEMAVSRLLIEPKEVSDLRPALLDLQSRYGSSSPDMFIQFAQNLTPPRLRPTKKPKRHRKKRTEHDHYNRPNIQLSEQLRAAVREYTEDQHRHRRLARDVSVQYQCYSLILTPTSVHLEGPLPDQSNDVIRSYGHYDNFLRVSFQDEDCSKLRRDFRYLIEKLLKSKYLDVLLQGIEVAGRHFQFLGYSMSGLKETTSWFVTPFPNANGIMMDADAIRSQLGNFDALAHKPARLAARWAQNFSASFETIVLEDEEVHEVPDKEATFGTEFTDGCSAASPLLFQEVWRKMRRSRTTKRPPSCFQFRFNGAKGVIVQNPALGSGKVLQLRPSQIKYRTPNKGGRFNVANTSWKPSPMFLNRPLITLLEHHGVDTDHVFKLQTTAVANVERIRSSLSDAAFLFNANGLGSSFRLPSLFNNLFYVLGLNSDQEAAFRGDSYRHEVVESAINFACTHVLREIKYRAHIPVPGSHSLTGVSDEWDCLEEGEIFATVLDPRDGVRKPIEGDVLVTRSPQIHPGDIQMAKAVRRKELEHLTNVVVFSCKGPRSLPSHLGGGDLDGDLYNLILDPGLFPTFGSEPGSYESLPHTTTQHKCTVKDVAEFFINYINSDLVGTIAILHLRFADIKEADCEECKTLAELASWAVDFPKTGTPVSMEKLPRPPDRMKPDFLAYEGSNLGPNFYPSDKLLGKLFRNVPTVDFFPPFEALETPSDGDKVVAALRRIRVEQMGLPAIYAIAETSELYEEMEELAMEFCDKLKQIAVAHTPSKQTDVWLSEGELVSGTIQAKWSDHRKRRDAVAAMNTQTQALNKATRQEIRRPPVHPAEEQDASDIESEDEYDSDEEGEIEREREKEVFRRAWAAWYVSEQIVKEEPEVFGMMSFGLVALGMALDIVKKWRQEYTIY